MAAYHRCSWVGCTSPEEGIQQDQQRLLCLGKLLKSLGLSLLMKLSRVGIIIAPTS